MFLIITLTLIVNSPLPIICDLLLFIQIMGLQVHLDIFMACKIHETFYEIEYQRSFMIFVFLFFR